MTRPIEIIAEIGVNWQGSMTMAENLIQAAAEAGADVAKFQLYDPNKRPDIDTHPHKDILLQCRLTKRKLYHLKEKCEHNKIEFMCSVFDVDKVDWLEQVGVKRYKVGSKSFYDEELRKRLMQTMKPVILSWGMVFYEGFEDDPYFHEKFQKTRSAWHCLGSISDLYCVSKYPTSIGECSDLRDTDLFRDFQGYSSHVPGIADAAVAMSRGAKIIEKHITMDRTQEGPDHRFSLDPDELKQMCKLRDDIERILYL